MSELDKITNEVPPTFLDSTEEVKKASLKELSKLLQDTFPIDGQKKFLEGITSQGLKKSNGQQVVRSLVENYLNTYNLLESDDNQSRLVNSKIKSSLQKQSEHLFDQLSLCKEDPNSLYFILGAVLKALINRN